MNEETRVICLYRVSTLGQVEKNDIPMQRQCCREFAAEQGWTIMKEFSEKGISGYKVSAKERDAIQEIQKETLAGTFDVLLVFMFDRLGRKDDETPFVVEWFVKNGIQVWSAKEGQQRFDTHVDKLMNYIRYWQASGESLKTSIRTSTRLLSLQKKVSTPEALSPLAIRWLKKDESTSVVKQSLILRSILLKLKLFVSFSTFIHLKGMDLNEYLVTYITKALLGDPALISPTQPSIVFLKTLCTQASLKMALLTLRP